MGYRYYDWECTHCGDVSARLCWVPHGEGPPSGIKDYCQRCDDLVDVERLISAPAEYMGEKPWAPMVAGGKFDTTGHAPVRQLPDPPSGAMSDPAALREHFRSPEWKDAKAQRAEQTAHNRTKRERTRKMQQGQSFNLRRSEDRLPGDPKI